MTVRQRGSLLIDATVKGVEQLEKAADKMIELGKAALGVASLGKLAGEFSELVARGGQVSDVFSVLRTGIDEASRALDGSITNFDLARSANALMLGGVQLSSAEFSRFASSAKALGSAVGDDAVGSLDKFARAVSSGRVESLAAVGVTADYDAVVSRLAQSLGVTADRLSDSAIKAAKQQAALEAVNAAAEKVGGSVATAGGSFDKLATFAKNSYDSLAQWVATSPALINAAQAISNAIIGTAQAFGRLATSMGDMLGRSDIDKKKLELASMASSMSRMIQGADSLRARNLGSAADWMEQNIAKLEARMSKLRREIDLAGGGDAIGVGSDAVAFPNRAAATGELPDFGQFSASAAIARAQGAIRPASATRSAKAKKEKAAASIVGQGDTSLTSFGVFGFGSATEEDAEIALEESGIVAQTSTMDREMQKQRELIAQAMEDQDRAREMVDQFGGAFANAIEAVVTGQASFGEAMARMASSMILQLGKMALVQALFETAMGFAALAALNPAKAATHFKSAALFGAVSAVGFASGAALSGATGGGGGGVGGTNRGEARQFDRPQAVSQQRERPDINITLRIDPGDPASDVLASRKLRAAVVA